MLPHPPKDARIEASRGGARLRLTRRQFGNGVDAMSSPSLASLAEEFGVEVEVIRLALGSNGPHDVYAPVRYLGVSGEEAHELVEQFFERNESERDCV